VSGIDRARALVLDAIDRRVFPAAVTDVGASRGGLWHEAFGTLAFSAGSPPTQPATAFDLASLTKVIATTTVVMELVAARALRLDERVADSLSEWRGDDRSTVTVRDLLEHASGLPARLLGQPPSTPREFEHDICETALEYRPRTASIYSDLGFILLGFLVHARAGQPLAAQFADVCHRLAEAEPGLRSEPLTFRPDGSAKTTSAPTLPEPDDSRRGRTLAGEVHDSYAALLGGAAGHAGLFGTAGSVAAFARLVLRAARGEDQPPPLSASLMAQFVRKSAVAGSSRALGWDTMLPTSSCGTTMSSGAIGHVGYTGTSLWIDPPRDRYYVLLTNRACGGGTLEEMRQVRRSFHDALHEL
jgi:serine-type D-Ala-D-Ala carboxypeptidase